MADVSPYPRKAHLELEQSVRFSDFVLKLVSIGKMKIQSFSVDSIDFEISADGQVLKKNWNPGLGAVAPVTFKLKEHNFEIDILKVNSSKSVDVLVSQDRAMTVPQESRSSLPKEISGSPEAETLFANLDQEALSRAKSSSEEYQLWFDKLSGKETERREMFRILSASPNSILYLYFSLHSRPDRRDLILKELFVTKDIRDELFRRLNAHRALRDNLMPRIVIKANPPPNPDSIDGL